LNFVSNHVFVQISILKPKPKGICRASPESKSKFTIYFEIQSTAMINTFIEAFEVKLFLIKINVYSLYKVFECNVSIVVIRCVYLTLPKGVQKTISKIILKQSI